MGEPIRVIWCIHCNDDEMEEWLGGDLVEAGKDNRGYYARVDTGDGIKLIELHRLDRESYLKVQAAYPELWEADPNRGGGSRE